MNDTVKVRLDKWLWAARFFKTRTLAKDAIEGGKAHYNGQRSKPGKLVEVGATIKVRQGWFDKVVIVRSLSDKRQTASIAQTLYEETPESIASREQQLQERKALAATRPMPLKRPNKRDRRMIHRFKNQNSDT
ncbi:MAG: ribosome-associated heat shock protein Hsp15 [Oleiphilus sp.]|nr:MAG: ribosome-associated heat shock protein Hsp15 [Oleiphilus sp.]